MYFIIYYLWSGVLFSLTWHLNCVFLSAAFEARQLWLTTTLIFTTIELPIVRTFMMYILCVCEQLFYIWLPHEKYYPSAFLWHCTKSRRKLYAISQFWFLNHHLEWFFFPRFTKKWKFNMYYIRLIVHASGRLCTLLIVRVKLWNI